MRHFLTCSAMTHGLPVRENAPTHSWRIVVILLLYLLLGGSDLTSQVTENVYHELGVLAKNNGKWPTPPESLIAFRNTQKVPELRRHAWQLLAGLTARSIVADPKSLPIWETWYTKDETFVSPPACITGVLRGPIHRKLEMPLEIVAAIQSEAYLNDEDASKSALDYFSQVDKSIHSNVLYNAAACEHIDRFGLTNLAGLQMQFKQLNAPAAEWSIPPFPSDSVIVKAFWKGVFHNKDNTLKVWDPPDPNRPNCHEGCSRTVKLRVAAAGEPCKPNKDFIPTSCFYNVPVTRDNLGEMLAAWPVNPGDVMILVAFHVITKEVPDWTWSTFWWHDKPDVGTFAEGRLDEIQGSWRNYLMDTTLSMETPWESTATQGRARGDIRDACGQNWEMPSRDKICFNPYLEHAVGGATNAALSNCMNCHIRSTFVIPAGQDMRGIAWRGYLSSDAPCLAGRLRLDYLWSLPHETHQSLQEFMLHLNENIRNQFKLR
jgi:hypothetical protein